MAPEKADPRAAPRRSSPHRRRLAKLATIDERSLALFRIGLAVVVLADLLMRSFELVAHYSDSGAIPRGVLDLHAFPDSILFPLYFLHGSAAWAAALFSLTAVSAAALLVGYRTRWAAAATAFLVFCLHARSPSVTHGGDDLMRILLLWSVLLPLGRCASLDAKRRAADVARSSPSIAGLLVQLHLTALFWIVPIAAENGSLMRTTALREAIAVDSLVSSWGMTMRGFADVIRFADVTISGFLLIAPILLWLPIRSGPLRTLVVLCLLQIGLLGVAPAFELGIQPWVTAVAWTLFIPSWFWSQFTERTRAGGGPIAGGSRFSAARIAAIFIFALVLLGALESVVRTASGAGTPPSWADRLGLGVPRMLVVPSATPSEGWLVARGWLTGKEARTIWQEGEFVFEKPPEVVGRGGIRWRVHLERLLSAPDPRAQIALTGFLCRQWNSAESRPPLERVELTFMLTRTDSAGERLSPLPAPLLGAPCGDSIDTNRERKTQ